MSDQATTISKPEFFARFKHRMLMRLGPKTAKGEDVASYADVAAHLYWDEPDLRVDGPEECADLDIECWGME